MQCAAKVGQGRRENGIGRVQEQRDTERRSALVERLQTLRFDVRVVADAARQVCAHQAQCADGVLENLDSDFGTRQRYGRGRPQPVRMTTLRVRHLFVPQRGDVAAFLDGEVGEMHGQRSD